MIIYYLCMRWGGGSGGVCELMVRGRLVGMDFSFCRVDPWDQLRLLDLVSMCCYPLSHPAGPGPTVFYLQYRHGLLGETMEYQLLVLSSVDSVHVPPVSGQSRRVREKQPWKSSSLHSCLFTNWFSKVSAPKSNSFMG